MTSKGLVHPKMKMSLCFTRPRSILCVHDFLLSDKSNRSYIKNCPGPSKPYSGVSRCFLSTVKRTRNKGRASVINVPHTAPGRWIKASCSKSMHFCKINIHISNVINTFFSLPLSVLYGRHSGGWRYPIVRLGGARTIFNITLIGFIWKKKFINT